MDKCDYLCQRLRELDVDVVVLQESHLREDSAPSRSSIPGYQPNRIESRP